ncbi:hypothetical protein EDB89DRAFT_2077003 [Lactarius sanguifluus]|nr:hypothetical protein EDB89DRAFT_2077003 [Lactarius sanguifluus]
MDFSKSIYWCGMPTVRMRSLAPASLHLVHDTLAITLSLSHPRSDVPILPFMRSSPTRVALRPASPAYPLRDSSARARVASSLIPCTPFAHDLLPPQGPELDSHPHFTSFRPVPILVPVRLPPPSSTSSPSPASRAAVSRSLTLSPALTAAAPLHADKGRAGPSPVSGPPRLRGPAAPRPLPSQHLPHSRGKGAHEGTSPRPLPAGARRTACPPQSPSAQATPAPAPRTPPRPARIRKRRDGAPTPPRGPRQPNSTRPALPAYARGRTGRDGAHSPALLGAGDTSPAPRAQPAFARGGTVRPPLRVAHAGPTPRTPPCPRTQEDRWHVQPCPTHARKGRDGMHSPALLGAGHQPDPTRPAHIRERRDGAPTPLRGPHQSSHPPPTHARGRVGASTPFAQATPARHLRTPPRPRTPGDARGSPLALPTTNYDYNNMPQVRRHSFELHELQPSPSSSHDYDTSNSNGAR